jgi:hypothetical protein
VDSKEYELKYLLDDEQRLERLMTLVGPDLRERVEPLLGRVRARIHELQTDMQDEAESRLPRAA